MPYSTPINAHTRLTSLLNLSHHPSPCIFPPPPSFLPCHVQLAAVLILAKFNITLTFPTTAAAINKTTNGSPIVTTPLVSLRLQMVLCQL